MGHAVGRIRFAGKSLDSYLPSPFLSVSPVDFHDLWEGVGRNRDSKRQLIWNTYVSVYPILREMLVFPARRRGPIFRSGERFGNGYNELRWTNI